MSLKGNRKLKPLTLIAFCLLLIARSHGQNIASKGPLDTSEKHSWKVIGPGGGGGVLLPTISPFDENIVLTHCDMTGAYISFNGGSNWRMFNLWTVPVDFEFDPANPNTIYTATQGYRYTEDRGSGLSILYRSEDKGKHWRIIYPDVSKAKKNDKLQNKDLLPSQIVEGAFDGTIEKIEVDPLDNNKIYLGLTPLKSFMGGGNQNKNIDSSILIVSQDYGKSWKKIAVLPGQNIKAIFPGNASGHRNEVVFFTEKSCARINESAHKITRMTLPVEVVNAVEGGKNIIYVLSDFKEENGKIKGGMFVSSDWGKTWIQINNGLLKGRSRNRFPNMHRGGIAVCETKPDVAYLSTINPMPDEKGTIEDVYCIFKTRNEGNSWEPVLLSSSQKGYITNNFEGSWMEQSYDPGWGGNPIDLGVAPEMLMFALLATTGAGIRLLTEEKPGNRCTVIFCPIAPMQVAVLT